MHGVTMKIVCIYLYYVTSLVINGLDLYICGLNEETLCRANVAVGWGYTAPVQYGKLAVSTKCTMCVWEIIIAEGERGYRLYQNWSQGYRRHQNWTDYRGLGVIKTGLVTRVQASSKLDWLQGYRHHQNWTGRRGTGTIKTGQQEMYRHSHLMLLELPIEQRHFDRSVL